VVNKAYEGGRTVVDIIKDGGVQLVMNTTEGAQAVEDSAPCARHAGRQDPLLHHAAASHAAAQAMKAAREGELGCESASPPGRAGARPSPSARTGRGARQIRIFPKLNS
jgi:carbamoyl-phosphate synthase large subunit